MGRFLLGGRYLWLLLQRLGKGRRRCAKGLGLESHQAMGEDDHLIMGVHVLVLALHAIHQVLEVDTAQGPILLHQDSEATLFHREEGAETTQDHPKIFHHCETVIMIADHILQVMTMVLDQLKTPMGNLCAKIRTEEITGGLLIEHQDHHLDLGPDLLSYHLRATDKEKGRHVNAQTFVR